MSLRDTGFCTSVRHVCACIVVCLLGCSGSPGFKQRDEPDMQVDQRIAHVIDEIERCPAWTKIDTNELERHKVIRCLDIIDSEETLVLRKAILELLARWRANDRYSVDNASKIFVMNRYLFKVPSKSRIDEARFFGGWIGVPHDEKEVNVLWPFTVAKDGTLDLVGQFGGYNGDDFQAIEEFDYLNHKFGRRR